MVWASLWRSHCCRHGAAAAGNRGTAILVQPEPRLDATVMRNLFEFAHIVEAGDEPFGAGKTKGEILNVGGAGHHHGGAGAVKYHGNWRFFGQIAAVGRDLIRRDDQPFVAMRGEMRRGRGMATLTFPLFRH